MPLSCSSWNRSINGGQMHWFHPRCSSLPSPIRFTITCPRTVVSSSGDVAQTMRRGAGTPGSTTELFVCWSGGDSGRGQHVFRPFIQSVGSLDNWFCMLQTHLWSSRTPDSRCRDCADLELILEVWPPIIFTRTLPPYMLRPNFINYQKGPSSTIDIVRISTQNALVLAYARRRVLVDLLCPWTNLMGYKCTPFSPAWTPSPVPTES